MFKRHGLAGAILAVVLLVGASPVGTGGASTGEANRYLVVFSGDYAVDGTYAVDGGYAVLCNYAVLSGYAVGCNYAVAHDYAVSLVEAAGGTVATDMLGQIGVLAVDSSNALFAQVMEGYAVVDEVGQDLVWQGIPAGGAPGGGGGPVSHADPAETLQWNMAMIRAPQAHATQGGRSAVDVGILDSGVDGNHVDFKKDGVSNVDCPRGRDFVPEGPSVSVGGACVDNQVHGTHVAGIVAARANGLGVVGVAPNVTLVPVKVCDSPGYCYASAVVAGVTYAGDAKLDVINMSFFVDDDELLDSTELKCMDDPKQRAFRRSVERALQYARSQGVTPVAALGNSDTDLGGDSPCEVVPAESAGVVGTMALGARSEKSGYSSYGSGAADIGAPGGNGAVTGTSCNDQVLSTVPAGTGYACLQGTSMASPHTAGVAALIVSQFGTMGSDGDVKLSPTSVESYLQGSAIDIGLPGYDECFGNGRVDALRAVEKDTSTLYDATAPFCPEYDE
jgi:subtilisin family serine protease